MTRQTVRYARHRATGDPDRTPTQPGIYYGINVPTRRPWPLTPGSITAKTHGAYRAPGH